jgi:hypothetical protein
MSDILPWLKQVKCCPQFQYLQISERKNWKIVSSIMVTIHFILASIYVLFFFWFDNFVSLDEKCR